MAFSQRLDLRQSQSLVMTPQLQQAIKLLQLSNLELTSFVEQELVRNPLLEPDTGEVLVPENVPVPEKLSDPEECPYSLMKDAPSSLAFRSSMIECTLSISTSEVGTIFQSLYTSVTVPAFSTIL